MLLASMNRRSRSIPFIPVTHTLHLLSISFRLDPSVTTRYRPVTRMESSPREINCHPFPYFPLSSLKSREYDLQFVISRCDTIFYVNPRKAFSAEKSNAIFIMSRAARGENECIRQFPNSITCSTCPCYRYTLCFHGKCDSRTWKFQTGIAE